MMIGVDYHKAEEIAYDDVILCGAQFLIYDG